MLRKTTKKCIKTRSDDDDGQPSKKKAGTQLVELFCYAFNHMVYLYNNKRPKNKKCRAGQQQQQQQPLANIGNTTKWQTIKMQF